MNKPSTSKWRTFLMSVLAAFIACHPAMGAFHLFTTAANHYNKVSRISEGTYTLGKAFQASVATFMEGMMLGSVAFLFTLPLAL